MATLNTAMTAMTANTRAVWKELDARSMYSPSPWLAPTHSPITAAMTL